MSDKGFLNVFQKQYIFFEMSHNFQKGANYYAEKTEFDAKKIPQIAPTGEFLYERRLICLPCIEYSILLQAYCKLYQC